MRLVVFPIFLSLLVVLGLGVPVPGPNEYRPGPLPPQGTTPICLELVYPVGAPATGLPTWVRLLAEPALVGNDPALYRAERRVRTHLEDGVWLGAGEDSIDIAGHHSAMLRLPRSGSRRLGHVVPFWQGTFITWLLDPPRGFPFQAVVVLCQAISDSGLGVPDAS